ncbi:MAG: PEP-CTERM sorting domain-containing protein [Deltaproteobacteria bacterium]|nr:PEP-CTERM sorting domain-containing protein [Deltaproteobacteria bacterium]
MQSLHPVQLRSGGFGNLGRHPDRRNCRFHQPADGLDLLQPRHHPGRGLRLRRDRRCLRDGGAATFQLVPEPGATLLMLTGLGLVTVGRRSLGH